MGPYPGGNQSVLNFTAPTIIKTTPGVLVTISVLVAGSAAGTAYDNNNASVTSAESICAIPNTVGLIFPNWPCEVGIVIVPGTGQTLSVSYS